MFTISGAEAGKQPDGQFSRSACWLLILFLGMMGMVNGMFYDVLITDVFAFVIIAVNVFASVLIILGCFGKSALFIHRPRRPAGEDRAAFLFPFSHHDRIPPEDSIAIYDNGHEGFSINVVQKKAVEKEDRLLREAAEYANTFLN